ncbi:MAG: hypothetical protein L0212_11120 [Acidobacteria bacterium]|nr:hypothetical protein [Acidobacteriota bacterium]
MKNMVAVSAALAVPCLLVSLAAAQVPFEVAKKDLESHWKKSYPTETVLAVTSRGAGVSSVKIINLRKVPYYSVPAKVRVKRANGSVANFSVSAIYARPGARWIFEDVGVGNVEQEKASGQQPPPFDEAEALIRAGWVDQFTGHGHTEIAVHTVHPNPAFKAYGQRFWYTYLVEVNYRSGNTRYQCKRQEARLVKENPGAPWKFDAYIDGDKCEGQNLR